MGDKNRGKLIEMEWGEYGTLQQLEEMILYQEITDITEDEIVLKNGVRMTIELSDADCCAYGNGSFEFSEYNIPLEAVITDFKIHEPIDVPDEGTTVRRNTVTIYHNQNAIVNANAETDAGNGGYYFSVTSLVVDGIHFPIVSA